MRTRVSLSGTRSEAVTAPLRGMIIGRSNLPLAHEGDALFTVFTDSMELYQSRLAEAHEAITAHSND